MPMAAISKALYKPLLLQFSIAFWVKAHQPSGDCSAQPGCKAMIGASSSGYCAEATTFCAAASTTETFTDEVPISIPNNNIYYNWFTIEALNTGVEIKTKYWAMIRNNTFICPDFRVFPPVSSPFCQRK